MARRAKPKGDGSEGSADPKPITNGFDASVAPEYIERVEALQAEIDAIMADARGQCDPLREDIAAVKKEAHENANIPRRALNAKIAERKARRKAEAIRANLSEDQQNDFDQLSHALGDFVETELGKAAQAKAAQANGGAEAH